jgi:hypothetical protein
LLGKNVKEANQKPSRKPIELVGFEEKHITRTYTSTLLRACRALTVRHFCGVLINIEVDQKTLARPQEMLVMWLVLLLRHF